jgi:hypothetical protein
MWILVFLISEVVVMTFFVQIVPMYQTTLVAMRALPISVKVLDNLAGILQSPFAKGEPIMAEISEAFQEFWHATYQNVTKPQGGWPAKIENCLQVTLLVGAPGEDKCSIIPSEDPAYDADTSQDDGSISPDTSILSTKVASDVDDLLWPESEEEDEPVCTSTPARDTRYLAKATFGTLGSALVTISSQEDDTQDVFSACQPSIASSLGSTPTKNGARPSTPVRPHKPSSSSVFTLSSSPLLPTSHRTPITPKRTPRSLSRSSSTVSRRLVNKENESPFGGITSVADRIAMISPTWAKSSSLGKRPWPGHEDEVSQKKQKTDSGFVLLPNGVTRSPGSDSSEEERLVEATLCSDIEQSPPSARSTPLKAIVTGGTKLKDAAMPSTGKRKRVFMDAVVVPTLAEVNRRITQSKTTAITVNSLKAVNSIYVSSHSGSSRTAKRRRSVACDPFLTPLQALQQIKIAGSGEHI